MHWEDSTVTPALLWDIIKLKIREASLHYARNKSKKTRERKAELEKNDFETLSLRSKRFHGFFRQFESFFPFWRRENWGKRVAIETRKGIDEETSEPGNVLSSCWKTERSKGGIGEDYRASNKGAYLKIEN